MSTTNTEPTATHGSNSRRLILGAGVAGLYQLHQLREQGLRVRASTPPPTSAAPGTGTVIPVRDSTREAYIYQYLFSEDLYKGWSWSEKLPGQPEIERWMHYVADTLDLRRDIRSSTTITSAHFDEAPAAAGSIRTDRGETIDRSSPVTCCGMLSAPMDHVFPGQESFHGQHLHTSRWPRAVLISPASGSACVGIGATGIQVIQTIADEVEHLTVFVRTPQYVLPMKSPAYGPAEQAAYKARFEELSATLPHTFTGFEYDFVHTWADCTPERRREVLEEIYDDGSLKLWLASFAEMFFDRGQRGDLRVRPGEDARAAAGPAADRDPGADRLRLRHPPRAARARYLEVYHRDNVEPGRGAGQPDHPDRAGGHRTGRRHRARARRHRHGHRFRRRHRSADPDRHPRP